MTTKRSRPDSKQVPAQKPKRANTIVRMPKLPAAAPAEPGGESIEMDAMDEAEWERGQYTPQANNKFTELAARANAVAEQQRPEPVPTAPKRPTKSFAAVVPRTQTGLQRVATPPAGVATQPTPSERTTAKTPPLTKPAGWDRPEGSASMKPAEGSAPLPLADVRDDDVDMEWGDDDLSVPRAPAPRATASPRTTTNTVTRTQTPPAGVAATKLRADETQEKVSPPASQPVAAAKPARIDETREKVSPPATPPKGVPTAAAPADVAPAKPARVDETRQKVSPATSPTNNEAVAKTPRTQPPGPPPRATPPAGVPVVTPTSSIPKQTATPPAGVPVAPTSTVPKQTATPPAGVPVATPTSTVPKQTATPPAGVPVATPTSTVPKQTATPPAGVPVATPTSTVPKQTATPPAGVPVATSTSSPPKDVPVATPTSAPKQTATPPSGMPVARAQAPSLPPRTAPAGQVAPSIFDQTTQPSGPALPDLDDAFDTSTESPTHVSSAPRVATPPSAVPVVPMRTQTATPAEPLPPAPVVAAPMAERDSAPSLPPAPLSAAALFDEATGGDAPAARVDAAGSPWERPEQAYPRASVPQYPGAQGLVEDGVAPARSFTPDDNAQQYDLRKSGALFGSANIRRNLMIAGGALAVLIVVLVLVVSRGSSKSAANEPIAQAPTEPTAGTSNPAQPTEPTNATESANQTTSSTKRPDETSETRTTRTAVATQTQSQNRVPAQKLTAKRVVVEYADPGKKPVPVPLAAPVERDEQTAVNLARDAYAAGNQRLFAGDGEGAIRHYQEALSLYPGYVAGYRGLGLAYDLLGEKKQALQSLRMYVRAAPAAKDVTLIKKRIARLEAK